MRVLFLGEGSRDVGEPGARVGGDYEGDVPRLARLIVAVIDARLDELDDLRVDVAEILLQCRERDGAARVVIGLAVQEIEIRMLADPESRRAALGSNEGIGADLRGDLEQTADPKALCASLIGRCSVPSGLDPSLFADVQRCKAWEALRPEVVSVACPRGFEPFARQLAPLLRAL